MSAPMKWSETVASKCRYGDEAGTIWGDWNILWENSENDYQGHASFIAEKDGKYSFYEWVYGSCSGCDDWEDRNLSPEQIAAEMKSRAAWFDDRWSFDRFVDRVSEARAGIGR